MPAVFTHRPDESYAEKQLLLSNGRTEGARSVKIESTLDMCRAHVSSHFLQSFSPAICVISKEERRFFR